MEERLTRAFLDYMTYGKPERAPASFGVSVDGVSSDGSDLRLTLTFKGGHEFCCMSTVCHHGLFFAWDFERLRESFRGVGVELRKPIVVHARVVYEPDAVFPFPVMGSRMPELRPLGKRREEHEEYNEAKAPH